MPRITNINPIGAVDVPALRLVNVAAGETIEVSQEIADSLLQQPTNWVAADTATPTIPATN